jgi:hypothetical protein
MVNKAIGLVKGRACFKKIKVDVEELDEGPDVHEIHNLEKQVEKR